VLGLFDFVRNRQTAGAAGLQFHIELPTDLGAWSPKLANLLDG
jgi:hypothetical protein